MAGRMDIVASELTGGIVRVWPTHGGIRASSLSYKYCIYHKIVVRNWIPIKHNTIVRIALVLLLYQVGTCGHVDLGQIVFDRIMKQVES